MSKKIIENFRSNKVPVRPGRYQWYILFKTIVQQLEFVANTNVTRCCDAVFLFNRLAEWSIYSFFSIRIFYV